MPALRLVLEMILNENLHAFVLDVKTAFLSGPTGEPRTVLFLGAESYLRNNSEAMQIEVLKKKKKKSSPQGYLECAERRYWPTCFSTT